MSFPDFESSEGFNFLSLSLSLSAQLARALGEAGTDSSPSATFPSFWLAADRRSSRVSPVGRAQKVKNHTKIQDY